MHNYVYDPLTNTVTVHSMAPLTHDDIAAIRRNVMDMLRSDSNWMKAPKKPPPAIRPEVWYDHLPSPESCMDAVRAMCGKGNQ